jgi:hypothetical protein
VLKRTGAKIKGKVFDLPNNFSGSKATRHKGNQYERQKGIKIIL